jgi:hypothetical protein
MMMMTESNVLHLVKSCGFSSSLHYASIFSYTNIHLTVAILLCKPL